MKNLLITHKNGSPFKWIRGCYELRKLAGEEYVVLNGGLNVYEPNFKKIVEKIANLDLSKESILKFTKSYGLPGTFFYYVETGSYKSYMLTENQPLLKWEEIFGAKKPMAMPYFSVENGFNLDKEDTHIKKDMKLWNTYMEPLRFLKLVLAEFSHAVRYLIKGENHFRLQLKLKLGKNNQLICPVSSLIEGAYSYLVWYIGHGEKLKECKGKQEFGCKSCEHDKQYFWQSDPRQVWGVKNCRVNVNNRAAAYRAGKTEKKPTRSYTKRKKALEFYKQGLTIEQIAQKINIDVNVVDRWIKINKV